MAKNYEKARWRRACPRLTLWDALRALTLALVIAALSIAALAAPQTLGQAQAQAADVVIHRVMASNPGLCYPVDKAYFDWIEIKNLSAEKVSLAGWRLADGLDLRGAFAFGDVELPARGTLVVYCDDAPEGAPEDAIFTGFRVSSDGEVLVLADAQQLPVQTLTLPPLGKGEVFARQDDGEYRTMAYEALQAELSDPEALRPPFDGDGVYINEVMPVNRVTLADEDGDFSDWVELYNGSVARMELTGWTMSDTDGAPDKWRLPPLVMEPGEYRIVFLSGKDRAEPDGELHANFGLSGEGESLRLYNAGGEVVSWVEFGMAPADVSLSRLPDGTLTDALPATPGDENTQAAADAARRRVSRNARGLYVNEIMGSVKGSDWIELHNAADARVDLAGMGLSDDPRHPRKWQFPEGISMEPDGYLVVYANKAGEAPADAPYALAADFAISAGEEICLSGPDGTIIDRVALDACYRDVSYGRAEGYDVYRCFAEATPGMANAEASYEKKAADVEFSEAGGAHGESSLVLTLTSDDDVSIYYTTDGSEPTTSSEVYDGPITLTSNVLVRARAWRPDVIPSGTVSRSFILNAAHTVRLVCVNGKRSALNGSSGALVTGAKGNGCDVYVEFYEPDGTQLVGQNCHFELMGHGSRIEMAQKGFRLQTQKAYGEGWFDAALFTNRPYTEYKSVVMRASGQDAFQTHMRDSILTSLAADTSLMYQESEVCVVYVNGQYWGVYNMRERVCPESIAQFEGWEDPDAINLLEGAGGNSVYAVQGSADGYREVIRWVKNHDMSSDANVAQLEEYVDVDNYLEYVAMQIYTCNLDLDNLRLYNNPAEGGRWRWIFYDQDLSYQVDRNNVRDWLRSGGVGSITSQDNALFIALMKNAAVRDRFLTRMGELLRTTCSAENVEAKMLERYQLLEPEMELECQRWKWKVSTWQQYCKNMLSYARSRPEKLRGYLREAFGLSDAQMQKYFGETEE